jgi:hypothetical protein
LSVFLRALQRLRSAPATSALGAVSVAALMFASVLVVRSAPRAEINLRLSDGAVWLPSTEIGGVSLLDGGSGTIAASLGVANPGDDFSVEQWGSDAIIVNRSDGTVSLLDGSRWSITSGRVQFGQPGQQLDVVADRNAGFVITPGQLVLANMSDMVGGSVVPVAAPFANGVVAEDGSLYYASSDPNLPVAHFSADGAISTPIPDLDGPTALIDLGTTTAAVDLDDRRVWLSTQDIVCDRLEFPANAVLHAGGGDGHLIVVSDQGGAFEWDPLSSCCPGAGDFINLGAGT